MKKQAREQLRSEDAVALKNQVTALKREYTVTLMQLRVGRLKDTRLPKKIRQKIAIINTIVAEKEQATA